MSWLYLFLAKCFGVGWPVRLKLGQQAQTRVAGICVSLSRRRLDRSRPCNAEACALSNLRSIASSGFRDRPHSRDKDMRSICSGQRLDHFGTVIRS
jgi:hypothetical protein